MNCPNCDQKIRGKYCPNCGQPTELPRIDMKYIIQEIGSVLSFKKGILFTIKELLIRPGQNVKTFIHEDRNRLVKPIIFVIFCSFIYTILQQLLHFEDAYVRYNEDSIDSVTAAIFQWIQANYGYANILMAIFFAFWIKLLFRKYGYNFFEILILLCFIFGIGMLIYSFFGVIEALTQLGLFQVGGLIGFVYTSWAIAQFFDVRKKMNYVKGLLAYILGLLSFSIAATAVGVLADLIIK